MRYLPLKDDGDYMTVALTALEAIDLSRSEGVSIAELEGMGFSVQTAGNANVQAKVVAPKTTPALVTAAALLFKAGKSRGKTKQGRPRVTLGVKEGSYPYAISVSIDPDYVSEA